MATSFNDDDDDDDWIFFWCKNEMKDRQRWLKREWIKDTKKKTGCTG